MDKLTGLGQTFDEYAKANEVFSVAHNADTVCAAYADACIVNEEFGALVVEDGYLSINGTPIAKMDDLAYGKVCSVLDIPTAYLMKLPTYMRDMNIMYWFRSNGEKSVTVVYRDDELLEIRDGEEISLADVFRVLKEHIPDLLLIRIVQQTNSTQFDFVDATEPFDLCGVEHYAGVRYIHKEGLKAPEITPILVSSSSCGVIEFADVYEKLNIKNMVMGEVLDLIGQRVDECFNYCDIADRLNHILEQKIANPRRRINLYCKEHQIPDRIRHRVLDCFDDLSWRGDFTVGEVVSIFATAGFLETVKQTSERKLQSLAGYIITKSQQEHRCEKCDSRTDED